MANLATEQAPVLSLASVMYQVPGQGEDSHSHQSSSGSSSDSSAQSSQGSHGSMLTILNGCDLRVQPGESAAIIGRSGSGKSTLLSIMAGLALPTAGDVHLLGQSLTRLNEDQRAHVRAQKVGFVFQNFQLMPSMSALENVLMPLELFQVDQAKDRAWHALDKVGLSGRLHHRPAALSGGEQQRVALARAFVTEPQVLFADEPTGNLDETTARAIQDLLFEMNAQTQTTLVLVTHDMAFAHHCQSAYQLQDGYLEAVDAAQ